MKVGQTVFIKNTSRYGTKINEDKIKSIGRKWFKLEENGCRFSIEDLFNDAGGYSSHYKVYFKMQDIIDEGRLSDLNLKLSRLFNYGKSKLTLEQLEAINGIIEVNNE